MALTLLERQGVIRQLISIRPEILGVLTHEEIDEIGEMMKEGKTIEEILTAQE